MKELYKSVSMDEGRVGIIEHSDSVYVVTKKTTTTEVVNTATMNNHLHSVRPFALQGEPYQVVAPKIIAWDETTGSLVLELKEGENLEALLSSSEGNRASIVIFTRHFLEWMKDTGTFWRGAAPRHIIINSGQKEISLFDFERPIAVKQGGFKDEEFKKMSRGLVHEEFCAFLFEDEQQVVFPNFWDADTSKNIIPLASIHGKRIKLLLENLFGPIGDSVQEEQLNFVYRFMSSAVTPFFIEGKPFYPLKAIDEKTRGAENYVDIILQLSKVDRSQWPAYLGYEIN